MWMHVACVCEVVEHITLPSRMNTQLTLFC